MFNLEFESSIIMDSKESISGALRDIADAIDRGQEVGTLPGEAQCMNWYISDDVQEEGTEAEDELVMDCTLCSSSSCDRDDCNNKDARCHCFFMEIDIFNEYPYWCAYYNRDPKRSKVYEEVPVEQQQTDENKQ